MKKLFAVSIIALLCLTSAEAANQITASVTVTNITTNGMTFSVNGVARTFTNLVFNPGTQILTNSDATGCGSKPNLFDEIALNRYGAGIIPNDTGSNTFQLIGQCGVALVVTPSAGWATVSYDSGILARHRISVSRIK